MISRINVLFAHTINIYSKYETRSRWFTLFSAAAELLTAYNCIWDCVKRQVGIELIIKSMLYPRCFLLNSIKVHFHESWAHFDHSWCGSRRYAKYRTETFAALLLDLNETDYTILTHLNCLFYGQNWCYPSERTLRFLTNQVRVSNLHYWLLSNYTCCKWVYLFFPDRSFPNQLLKPSKNKEVRTSKHMVLCCEILMIIESENRSGSCVLWNSIKLYCYADRIA